MKKFFGRFFATIGVIVCIPIILALIGFLFFKKPKTQIPDDSILVVDLSKPIPEGNMHIGLSLLVDDPLPNMFRTIDAIQKAAKDPKITKIALLINENALGLGQQHELREALIDFRKSGKKIHAYSTLLGDLAPGLKKYYMASVADTIWMQPLSGVTLTGIHTDQPYLGEFLENFDVKAQIFSRGEYKNAYSFLTNKEATDAEKEANTHVLRQIITSLNTGIETARNLKTQTIQNITKSSPFLSDKQAYEYGLIDGAYYYDEFLDMVLNGEKTKEINNHAKEIKQVNHSFTKDDSLYHNSRLIHLSRYSKYLESKREPKKEKIAIIYGDGPIMSKADSQNPFDNAAIMSAKTILNQFDDVFTDPEIKAIVFRINSPGGSANASETIRRVVDISHEFKIPVVASFADYAASGGYWIAAFCDRIYANPLTFTGSIGAIGGKVTFRGLLKNFDIHVDSFSSGHNGSLWSPLSEYNDEQEEHVKANMDRLYAEFIKLVAEGRNLSLDHVSEIAKGRVWTGQDALKFGLVDELGGIMKAVEGAAKLVNITDLSQVEIVEFPKKKSVDEMLLTFLKGDIDTIDTARSLIRSLVLQLKILTSSETMMIAQPPVKQ